MNGLPAGLKGFSLHCQCLKSFSIFSRKSLTSINGIFPTHEARQTSISIVQHLYYGPWERRYGTTPCCARYCIKDSSSSYPDKRYGGLNAHKDLLIAHSQPLTWNKPPRESSQAFVLPFFWSISGYCTWYLPFLVLELEGNPSISRSIRFSSS